MICALWLSRLEQDTKQLFDNLPIFFGSISSFLLELILVIAHASICETIKR